MLFENRQHTQGERDPMRLPHFHSAGGNFPHCGVEIEFDPFSSAQFAWSHESQGEQFERGPCFGRALIVLNGSQQSAERVGRYYGRTRRHCWRYQRATQRGGRIVLSAGGGNRVAENVAYRRSELASSLVYPSRLYLLEDDQNLTRRNLVDRSRSECGKRKAHEPVELSQRCRRFLVATLLIRQFASDGRERVRVLFASCGLCGLLDLGRVLAMGQGLPGAFAGVPSVFQTDFGINANGERLLNASEAVSEPPPFRS